MGANQGQAPPPLSLLEPFSLFDRGVGTRLPGRETNMLARRLVPPPLLEKKNINPSLRQVQVVRVETTLTYFMGHPVIS